MTVQLLCASFMKTNGAGHAMWMIRTPSHRPATSRTCTRSGRGPSPVRTWRRSRAPGGSRGTRARRRTRWRTLRPAGRSSRRRGDRRGAPVRRRRAGPARCRLAATAPRRGAGPPSSSVRPAARSYAVGARAGVRSWSRARAVPRARRCDREEHAGRSRGVEGAGVEPRCAEVVRWWWSACRGRHAHWHRRDAGALSAMPKVGIDPGPWTRPEPSPRNVPVAPDSAQRRP